MTCTLTAYSNPDRENDPHALPDIEVFYHDSKRDPVACFDDGSPMASGWYWWACFPGCMPDSDPVGPFATEAEALADAQNTD